MSVFCQRKTSNKVAREQSRQPTRLLLGRRKGVNGVDNKRPLHGRQRAQAGISPFELLHDEAVRGVTKTGATVLFEVRRVKTQRTHTRDEIIWEFGRAMTRNDLGLGFLLDKTPRSIARRAFFLSEKRFDAVVIQRSCGHVISAR